MYLANQRQGTASTKTRAEVRGGGRKPWRQKGTGRARHGSIRSPIWVGGGVVFGPKPREYRQAMPKKARRAALRSALSAKVRDGELIVSESLTLAEPKTKQMAAVLGRLSAERKPLIVLAERDRNVELSTRNLPGRGHDAGDGHERVPSACPRQACADERRRGQARGGVGLMHPRDVLNRPIITEKATALMEQGKYVFEVDRNAQQDADQAGGRADFRRESHQGEHDAADRQDAPARADPGPHERD